jgi:hypothetical protein
LGTKWSYVTISGKTTALVETKNKGVSLEVRMAGARGDASGAKIFKEISIGIGW